MAYRSRRLGFRTGIAAWGFAALACRVEPAAVSRQPRADAPKVADSAAPEAPNFARPAQAAASAGAEPVPAVDLSRIDPASFSDEELDLPYFLAHFSEVANSVALDGPERGFIALPVWRTPSAPFNARVMENVLALAYFYTLDRPWNPYRGSPAVRARLEAALEYWLQLESPEGLFSEYGVAQWGLAPTAFATKFMGETLTLLRGAALAPGLFERVLAADRRAVLAVLTQPNLFTMGRSYTNQYTNVWGGGLAYLSLDPDPVLRVLWDLRFAEVRDEFQSPAGYYYEADGPDFGYTLNTHGASVRQAWQNRGDGPLAAELVARETVFFDWLARNAIPEPDGGFVVNAAIGTRQELRFFSNHETPIAREVSFARALSRSREEMEQEHVRMREQLRATWPAVEPLLVPEFASYNPYKFLHRRAETWLPSTAERDAARAELPVLAQKSFTEERRDSRKKVVYTFVRRPDYYATFTQGERCSERQRYGLGLLWNPALGAVLQSQAGSNSAAWGTRGAGMTSTYEGESLDFAKGSEKAGADAGIRRFAALPLSRSYKLGGRDHKTVTFGPAEIAVSVVHRKPFTEVLPLLVGPDATLELSEREAVLSSPAGRFIVAFEGRPELTEENTDVKVGKKRLVILAAQSERTLRYSLRFAAP
jgi:hypothetical protein